MDAEIRRAFRELGGVCTPAAILKQVSMPEDDAYKLLMRWEDDGYLESWDADGGLLVRLTERGADRLGLLLEDPAQVKVDESRSRESKRNWAGPLRVDGAGYPYPNVLLEGLCWDNVMSDVCGTCRDRPLRDNQYCLRCDRWGLDAAAASNPEVYARGRRRP